MSDPLRVLMSGPLSEFAAGFREELLGRGYRPGTSAKQLQLMAHLSRWLVARDLEPAALGREQIERFVQERRASRAQLASAYALEPLLGHLRALRVVPPAGSRGRQRRPARCLTATPSTCWPSADSSPPRFATTATTRVRS